MARIRTIKPEFWTDEKLTECSLNARLLFIGLWNFSDDYGNLQRSSKKIKMQVFPADQVDCEPLILDLITHGVLTEYSVNGEKFLHIKGFNKHQIVNRPSKSVIPPPPLSEYSLSTHTGEERRGEERKEESKYRFAGKIIKLSEKDFEDLKKQYHAIPDFEAELCASDNQYQHEPPGKWYVALVNRLALKHQSHLARQKQLATAKSAGAMAAERDKKAREGAITL